MKMISNCLSNLSNYMQQNKNELIITDKNKNKTDEKINENKM